MTRAGDILVSLIEGKERLVIRTTGAETGGALLEMDAHHAPGGAFPPSHEHPEQDEHSAVLAGAITVRMAGRERVYQAGESFDVPRGTSWPNFYSRGSGSSVGALQ
jgi:quercetin dioxygenase-like cupin family protein